MSVSTITGRQIRQFDTVADMASVQETFLGWMGRTSHDIIATGEDKLGYISMPWAMNPLPFILPYWITDNAVHDCINMRSWARHDLSPSM